MSMWFGEYHFQCKYYHVDILPMGNGITSLTVIRLKKKKKCSVFKCVWIKQDSCNSN